MILDLFSSSLILAHPNSLRPASFRALAQVRLEDVFRSTQENMTAEPSSWRLAALILGTLALTLLLLVLQRLRRRAALAKPINNHSKLLKEIVKAVPLRPSEIARLEILAEQLGCCSPLVPLLCPSLLEKGLNMVNDGDRQQLAALAARFGARNPP